MIASRAAGLALLAVLLAGPVSAGLARARWVDRTPTAVAVLWQAICLTSGVVMIEAGLTVALAPLGPSLGAGLLAWWEQARQGRPLAGLSALGIACGVLAAMASAVLLGALVRSAVWAGRRRRAHRAILDLLTGDSGGADPDVGPGVRVLDHPRAVAYTVPGWHARIVLSAGLVDLLDADEVEAVVGHERAHVEFRHDLLVLPFQAWERTLGLLPGVREAGAAMSDLTEMMADDRAVRSCNSRVLASALVKVGLAEARPGSTGAAPAVASRGTGLPTRSVVRRVRRLDGPRPVPWVSAAVWTASVCLLAVPVAGLLLPW